MLALVLSMIPCIEAFITFYANKIRKPISHDILIRKCQFEPATVCLHLIAFLSLFRFSFAKHIKVKI